jgi:hypothetical protein
VHHEKIYASKAATISASLGMMKKDVEYRTIGSESLETGLK